MNTLFNSTEEMSVAVSVGSKEITRDMSAHSHGIAVDIYPPSVAIDAGLQVGLPGVPGKDGFSPAAKVTETESGATITITDKDGTTTAEVRHGTSYKIGDGLKVTDNVLAMDMADAVEEDNTKPITSAAVYTEIGNINALLATI